MHTITDRLTDHESYNIDAHTSKYIFYQKSVSFFFRFVKWN